MNDYLPVSKLGVWLVLAAAGILLIFFLIWGIWGELPTTLSAEAFIKDETAVCTFAQEEAGDMSLCSDDKGGSGKMGSEPFFGQKEEDLCPQSPVKQRSSKMFAVNCL